METVELEILTREPGGKGKARRLRRAGKLPGIFYGPKSPPVPLELDQKEFLKRMGDHGTSQLIRIKSSSPLLADRVALLKTAQSDPVTGEIIHADFYEVDLTVKIRVKVPLQFAGKAAGVVRGGILQPIVREVEVECLPMDIPGSLSVEVSSLDIGDSLHITDVSIPEGVKAIYEDNYAVVTVVPPTIEEAPVAEAKVEVVEGAEAPAAARGCSGRPGCSGRSGR